MSGFTLDIENFITRIYKRVNIFTVIQEAITNSIHANSTQIDIILHSKQENKKKKELEYIEIIDNGDGLTKENRNAFMIISTDHKKNIGGKGFGRFSYLAFADNVEIKSKTNKNEYIRFQFKDNMESQDIEPKEQSESINQGTIIQIKNIKKQKQYYDTEYIKNTILEKLKIFLYLNYQKSNKNTTINFIEKTDFMGNDKQESIETIIVSDIIPIKTKKIKIKDKKFTVYAFQESNTKINKIKQCFLADHISVEEKIIGHYNNSYTYCVASDFFDKNVNDSRTGFEFEDEILEENETIWQTQLIIELKEMTKEIDNNFENNLQKIHTYLKRYYGYEKNINEYISNDFLNLNDAIASIREKSNKEEDYLLSQLCNESLSVEEKTNAIDDLNSKELAKYIFHRDFIIQELETLIENKEKYEHKFHSFLFPKKITSNNELQTKYLTRLWLLDDKFMSYESAYSDKKISKILSDLGKDVQKGYQGQKEPDITVFYSKSESNYKDIVMCELKSFSSQIEQKVDAITEINRNIRFLIKNLDNINTTYAFIITDLFNEELQDTIEGQQGVKKLFTNSHDPLYYLYNENIKDKNNNNVPTHIYIMSINTLLKDARSRNKVFLDILTQNDTIQNQ